MPQENAGVFLHSFSNSRGYSLKINLFTCGLVLYSWIRNSHSCPCITEILIAIRRLSSQPVLESSQKNHKPNENHKSYERLLGLFPSGNVPNFLDRSTEKTTDTLKWIVSKPSFSLYLNQDYRKPIYAYYICYKMWNFMPEQICFIAVSVQVITFSMFFAVKIYAGSSHTVSLWSWGPFSAGRIWLQRGKVFIKNKSLLLASLLVRFLKFRGTAAFSFK